MDMVWYGMPQDIHSESEKGDNAFL